MKEHMLDMSYHPIHLKKMGTKRDIIRLRQLPFGERCQVCIYRCCQTTWHHTNLGTWKDARSIRVRLDYS